MRNWCFHASLATVLTIELGDNRTTADDYVIDTVAFGRELPDIASRPELDSWSVQRLQRRFHDRFQRPHEVVVYAEYQAGQRGLE